MSLLGNILGNSLNKGPMNPTNLVQNNVGANPQQMLQLFMKAGNSKNAKAEVINMLQNGDISKDKFEQVKNMASRLGINDKQFGELERYLK